jgi:hypothetical protein
VRRSSGQLDFSSLVEAVEELTQIAEAMAAPPQQAAPHAPDTATSSGGSAAAASADAAPSEARKDQIAALRADNERLEADRREMGLRLGEHRATVAKVRGTRARMEWAVLRLVGCPFG